MQNNDSAIQYWQTLGLQEEFDNIFNDEVTNEHNGHTKETVSTKLNIMEGWSDERKKEWGET